MNLLSSEEPALRAGWRRYQLTGEPKFADRPPVSNGVFGYAEPNRQPKHELPDS
jgi:hypothetical protein